MIRQIKTSDIEQITKIYNGYIADSLITFEEELIDSSEMRRRIKIMEGKEFPFIVWEEEGNVIGYAYAGTFRERNAYRFTVESSIYLDPKYFGKGIGKKLYNSLISNCREKGYHSMIGVITLPNEISVRLHESLGFKKVGHLTESGFKFGKWADVGFWELLLKYV